MDNLIEYQYVRIPISSKGQYAPNFLREVLFSKTIFKSELNGKKLLCVWISEDGSGCVSESVSNISEYSDGYNVTISMTSINSKSTIGQDSILVRLVLLS